MPGKDKEEKQDKRALRSRKWLKEALRQLLAAKDYDDISITDISDQADVSRFTFYKHYETKDALLLHIIEDLFDQIYASASPDDAGELLSRKTSKADFALNDSFFSRDQEDYFVLKLGFERFSAQILASMEARRMTLLKKMQSAGKFAGWSDADLQVFNILLSGGILALFYRWLSGELAYEADAIKNIANGFFEALYKDGPPL